MQTSLHQQFRTWRSFSAGAITIIFTVFILVSAAAAQINFEPPTFVPGSPNLQNGWSKTGPYDQVIHTNVGAPPSFGLQSYRISNAVTSGSFGDHTFSSSIANEAGETSAQNGGLSGGIRKNRFESEFSIASVIPGALQPGLLFSMSPDRGDGARMSYLRFEDQADGIHVFFDDYQDIAPFGTSIGDVNGCSGLDDFIETDIATLDRTLAHTVKFQIDFVDGMRNDIVRIFINGVLVHTGTSWEDYFRFCESNETRTVDSMIILSRGPAAPATLGAGFLIDGLTMSSVTPSITVTPATSPTASDNDYTRINNAVQAIAPGGTITLSGTFDWTEANADASWEAGSDGILGNGDDWSILAPANLNGVTVTAASLGSARIQGPGDLAEANLEGVFQFYSGGTNQNWTISNLEIFDFDNAIGYYFAGGPVSVYEGTQIINNHLRTARDLNSTVAPIDVNQNIAIHFAFGTNQLISGNMIDMYGDGVSDSAGLRFSTEVGMQSNTSGGTAYDGLQITNNNLRVLNAQSVDPQVVLGIWENAHGHTSDILVSGNSFTNLAGGNNPAVNLQRGFRLTSHSSATTTVTYSENSVVGANIGFQWISGSNFAGEQPIRMTSNTVRNGATGFLVQSNGRGTFAFNRIVGNSVAGIDVVAGSTVDADDNWWGCNFGPGATGTGCAGTTNGILGTATAATWLTLTTSASPNLVISGGNSSVTSSLRMNSASFDTSVNGSVPNTTPAAFAGTLGTVSPSSATTLAGLVGTTFTGVTAGAGGVTTTVDGQSVSTSITVLPTCAPVSVAAGQTTLRNASLVIPITVGDMTSREAYSYDFTYTYNPSALTFTGVNAAGTLSSGFTITTDNSTPGTLVVSGFGATPLAGAGTLLNVNFTASGTIGSSSPLTLSPFAFNEGSPCATVSNGDITIISGTVDGTVSYLNQDGQNPQPRVVPGVNLNAPGSPSVSGSTNASGFYSLSGFGNSGYTVTPSKSSEVYNGTNIGITANDAARIAQHVVGTLPLTSNQQLAADVSNNGTITSFDSSIIARWVVNLPAPGVTGTWRFVPSSRTYTVGEIESGMSGQNYDAVLMGDVTGNWNVPPPLWEALSDFDQSQAIDIGLPEMSASVGSEFTIPVFSGDTTAKRVISYEFELRFDPSVIRPAKNPCVSAETISAAMTVTCNAEEPGIIRVAVFGASELFGKGELLRLRFTVVGDANSSSDLEFVKFAFNESEPFAKTRNGRLSVSESVSADTIAGRVFNASGEPIRQATVRIADSDGNEREMVTNQFGGFRFSGLVPNESYELTVTGRGYTFRARTIVVNQNAGVIEIYAEQ